MCNRPKQCKQCKQGKQGKQGKYPPAPLLRTQAASPETFVGILEVGRVTRYWGYHDSLAFRLRLTDCS